MQPDSANTPNIAPTPQSNNNGANIQPAPVYQNNKGEGWKSIASTILILIAAPLVAILLTTYVFQSYEVDGPSMQSTLQDKDRLIVLKIQKTWAKITGHYYIPNRGDVIVFNKKGLSEFGASGDKQLIKRVIGLPGERVVVINGTLTIYNKNRPEGFMPDKGSEWEPNINTTQGNVDLVVPPGEIFVCGDNRGNSLDSRAFGTVQANDIVGHLVLRILPLNQAKVF